MRLQFSLAAMLGAVTACALGFFVIVSVDRMAPGPAWAWLAAVYYFGALGVACLRASRRWVRYARFMLAGVLIGIVPGFFIVMIEELSGDPTDAFELGSITTTAMLGLFAGFALAVNTQAD